MKISFRKNTVVLAFQIEGEIIGTKFGQTIFILVNNKNHRHYSHPSSTNTRYYFIFVLIFAFSLSLALNNL